jgi:uncharacterized phage protein gp47/JayE
LSNVVYPLATLGCTITAAGIMSPAYADVLGSLQASFQSIYGSDSYLDADSQDGQLLAIIAKAIYDTNQVAIFVYNQFSPATSQGAGLSSVVKINGIARQIPSNSTVNLTLVGQAGTQIVNGAVSDGTNLWLLPALVTIPAPQGQVIATATCATLGAIAAAPGAVSTIATPTLGWQTATNLLAAVPGQPVESDAALRGRQAVSAANAAKSPLDSVLGNVLSVPGVVSATIYENQGSAPDQNGVPGHSIAVVTLGGNATAIAMAIAQTKTPGTGTYGTTTEVIVDASGVPNTINFFQLSEVLLSVVVTIAPKFGYIGSTGQNIVNSVATFINALGTGNASVMNFLWSPIGLSGDAATTATGQPQAALDLLRPTYAPQSIFQARADMVATATAAAGAATVLVANAANYQAGSICLLTRDDASLQQVTISGVSGKTLTFAPVVAPGRSVPQGSLIFVQGDVAAAFNENLMATASTINLIVT